MSRSLLVSPPSSPSPNGCSVQKKEIDASSTLAQTYSEMKVRFILFSTVPEFSDFPKGRLNLVFFILRVGVFNMAKGRRVGVGGRKGRGRGGWGRSGWRGPIRNSKRCFLYRHIFRLSLYLNKREQGGRRACLSPRVIK